MDLSRIQLVSWDLDGTLYNIGALYRQIAFKFCRETVGGNFSTARHELKALAEFQKRFGQRRLQSQICREVMQDLDRQSVRLLERKWFSEGLQRLSPPRRILKTLEEFRAKGLRQVVLSNFEAEYKIKALRLDEYFEKIWECEYMEELKPSVRPFRLLQEHHQVLPNAHLHIGDRDDIDGEGARRAGCSYLDVRQLRLS